MTFVSPGVYARELDFSLYAVALSSTIAGMVASCTKGPVEDMIYISSQPNYIRIFGPQSVNHYGPEAALTYLGKGTSLWYVRPYNTAMVKAYKEIAGQATAGFEEGTEIGPFDIEAASAANVTVGDAGNYSFAANVANGIMDSAVMPPPNDGTLINPGDTISITILGRTLIVPLTTSVGVAGQNATAAAITTDIQNALAAVDAALGFPNWTLYSPFATLVVAPFGPPPPNAIYRFDNLQDTTNLRILDVVGVAAATLGFNYPAQGSITNPITPIGMGDQYMLFNPDGLGDMWVKVPAGTYTAAVLAAAYINTQTTGINAYDIGGNFLNIPSAIVGAASVLQLLTGIIGGTAYNIGYAWDAPLNVLPGTYNGSDGDNYLLVQEDYGFTLSGVDPNWEGITPTLNQFNIDIDSVGVQLLTLTAASCVSAAATAAEIQARIDIAFGLGAAVVTYNQYDDQILIRSTTFGGAAISNITVTAGPPGRDCASLLKLLVGATVADGHQESIFLTPGTSIPLSSIISEINAAFNYAVASDSGGLLKISSKITGLASGIQVDLASTAAVTLGLDSAFHPGTETGAPVWLLEMLYYGSYGNDYQVMVNTGFSGGNYRKVALYTQGSEVQTVDDVNPASTPEDYFNAASTWMTLTELIPGGIPQASATLYDMAGGSDGITTKADYIGTSAPNATGLQKFADPEMVDVNLIAIPGSGNIDPQADIDRAMITLCENRGDVMCICDPPYNLGSPQAVVEWHNGVGGHGNTAALNSSYAALYWPWVKVYDAWNAQDIWTPPSGHVLACYAYNDYVRDPWWAPAGLKRARITWAKDVEYVCNLGDRNLMYGGTNAVNPIAKFTVDGICIWGQKTLYRATSRLNRVNVRRMLLYAKKVLSTSVRYVVFDPADDYTCRQIEGICNPALEVIKKRRGLYEFEVKCEGVQDDNDLNNNMIQAYIYLRPTAAAEAIILNFVITAVGVSFDEIVL